MKGVARFLQPYVERVSSQSTALSTSVSAELALKARHFLYGQMKIHRSETIKVNQRSRGSDRRIARYGKPSKNSSKYTVGSQHRNRERKLPGDVMQMVPLGIMYFFPS